MVFKRINKTCKQCGNRMPIAEFGKNRSTPDGHTYHCKRCCRRITRESYHRRKEIHRQIAKQGDASGKIKLCKGCGLYLPYKSFRMNARQADGKHRRCRLCSVPALAKKSDAYIHSMGYL